MKKNHLIFISLLVFSFLIIYSCRKSLNDLATGQPSVPSSTIESARIWQATHLKGSGVKLQGFWKNSWSLQNKIEQLLIVPAPERQINNANRTVRRVLVFTLIKNRVYDGKIIEFWGDKYNVSDNLTKLVTNYFNNATTEAFNGSIFEYDINYTPITGFRYKQGRKLPVIALATRFNGGVKSDFSKRKLKVNDDTSGVTYNPDPNIPDPSTVPSNCTIYTETDYGYTNGVLDNITTKYLGETCTDTAVPNDSSSSDASSSSADGTPDGPLYSSIQGGAPPASPTLKLNLDSLHSRYPCLANLISGMATSNNAGYFSLVHQFQGNGVPNNTWLVSDIYGDVTIPGTAVTLGDTKTDLAHSQSTTTTLNSSMIEHSSQLLVIATVIHESIHSAINYYLQQAYYDINYDPTVDKGGSWIYQMPNYILLAQFGNTYNATDHMTLLTNYFDQAVATLAATVPGYTTKDYQMAMLLGTNYAGPNATAAEIAAVNSTYNSVLTAKGISASDMNTFKLNNQNVANAALRMPTGCQ